MCNTTINICLVLQICVFKFRIEPEVGMDQIIMSHKGFLLITDQELC